MKNGFLKVAVTTPDLRVADCEYNKNQMVEKVQKMLWLHTARRRNRTKSSV